VSGTVRYVTGRLCEGCTVEVTDGLSAGTSVLTEANGRFSLSISFASAGSSVTLRASRDGYLPATQTTRGEMVFFTLESSHPLDLTGTYAMTIEAGAQCAELPEAIRRREYVVTLTGLPERPRSAFVAWPADGTFNTFAMRWLVSNNEVQARVSSGESGELPGIVERLGPNERIVVHAFSRVEAITAASSIRIPLDGQFEHCTGGTVCSSCQSLQHLLTMTRR
jgi:hypothetical protein